MYLQWDWNKTLKGTLQIGLLFLLFSFIYQNIAKINTAFLQSVPVGLLSLAIISMLIIRHLYKEIKWNYHWIKKTKHWEKTLIHICLYLIAFSIVFSIPLANISYAITTKISNNTDNQSNQGIYGVDYGAGTDNDVYNPETKTWGSGGSKIEKSSTSSSKVSTSSSNIFDKIKSKIEDIVNKVSAGVSSPYSEVVGTWEYTLPLLEASMGFTFNSDGTGEAYNPMIGRFVFDYRIEGQYIILSNPKPCVLSKSKCEGEDKVKFQRKGNYLILDIGGDEIPFKKV